MKSYFRGSGRLLVLNLEKGDGWDKLCPFLGVSIPPIDFPHANRQRYTAENYQELVAKKKDRRSVRCQACDNLTPVKKPASQGGRRKAGRSPITFDKRGLRKLLRRQLKRFSVTGLKGSASSRSLMYGLNRSVEAINRPLMVGSRSRFSRYPVLPRNELGVVACLFNPSGSRRRVANFRAFLDGVRASGVRCLVVELAFGANPFVINDHEDLIQLRSNHVLWHKERLLNLGIRRLLADGIRKIAWLDGDIVFENSAWPHEIVRCLDRVSLCQVFDSIAIRGHESGAPMVGPSATRYFIEHGGVKNQEPARSRNLLRGMLKGGQSGFGWAARAEVLEQQLLFEHAVVGGGDKLLFAASVAGSAGENLLASLTRSRFACSRCGHRNESQAYSQSFLAWSDAWSRAVAGSVGYAPLRIQDMYHGKRSDRGYMTRHDILYRHDFDPATDIVATPGRSLAWSSDKHDLRQDVEAYFMSRREDV